MTVNVSDGDGWISLHHATMFNRTDVIRYLLRLGMDVNRQDRYNEETPLHFAARNNHTEVARLLIDNEVDIKIKNDVNKTPLDVADKGSELERLLQLLQ